MKSRIIKWMVFAISFYMFLYQGNIAINKLMNPTVLDNTERLNITDIQQPLITVCPQKQFVYDGGMYPGYLFRGYKKFEGSLGWGAQKNMTFEQLKEELYDLDLETISIRQETKQGFKRTDYDIRFYNRFGWCFDISNYTISGVVHLKIKTRSKLNVQHAAQAYLTDKNLRTMSTVHTPTQWGSDIVLFPGQTAKFVVKVEQLSSFDPFSPDSCKEYVDGEFERCVDEELQKVWKPLINCNPPWVSPQDQCTGLQNVSNAIYQELMKEPEDTWSAIFEMKTYAAKERCTKPCTLTRSNILSNGLKDRHYTSRAYLMIMFDDLVIKHTKALGYNFSDFLIDMGSSLGLWFGLSVFGILDLGILIMQWMKKFKKAMKYFN